MILFPVFKKCKFKTFVDDCSLGVKAVLWFRT